MVARNMAADLSLGQTAAMAAHAGPIIVAIIASIIVPMLLSLLHAMLHLSQTLSKTLWEIHQNNLQGCDNSIFLVRMRRFLLSSYTIDILCLVCSDFCSKISIPSPQVYGLKTNLIDTQFE